MKNIVKSVIVGALIGLIIAMLIPAFNNKPQSESTRTKIMIVNGTNKVVKVWITLGETDGCLQHANHIPFVVDTLGSLVGNFALNPHDSTIAYAPDSMGYNGVISFNTQPVNCPTIDFPNGVNIYEFIINNLFQQGDPQETMDISCVSGVSCFIRADILGSNQWNAGGNYKNIQSIVNGDITNNSGRVGVFPYSCDSCIKMYQPPFCDTIPTDKQKELICTVQRDAKKSDGGLIKVIYLGHN